MTPTPIVGVLMTCAAVAVATAAGWLFTALAARALLAWRHPSAPNRALLLAQARLLPLAAVAILVPTQIHAFLSYETGGVESAGPMLLSVGLAGLVFGLGAAWRGVVAWRETARVVGTWKSTAVPLSIDSWPQAAWTIRAPFPVVALVGATRPQLFVARQVVEACTNGELDAIVAHEAAHATARDNLLRLLFHITPGAGLCRRIADPLERAWLTAAEETADLQAGRLTSSLELASALTKVARLATAGVPSLIPASTLIGNSDLPSRVQRLLQAPSRAQRHPASWLPVAVLLGIAALGQLPAISLRVHDLFELLVRHG